MTQIGETASVKQVVGKDEARSFLLSLGFVEGGDVTVVSELGGEPDRQCQGRPRGPEQGHGQQNHGVRRKVGAAFTRMLFHPRDFPPGAWRERVRPA